MSTSEESSKQVVHDEILLICNRKSISSLKVNTLLTAK